MDTDPSTLIARWPLLARCPLCARVRGAAREPGFIAELEVSHALLADNQGCRGWCTLILKGHAEHLAELPAPDQEALWRDVSRTAAAIRAVFPHTGAGGAPPRINYECLGNMAPHIHWHLIPRHADDPEPTRPVWGWAEERLKGSMTDAERRAWAARLRGALRGPGAA